VIKSRIGRVRLSPGRKFNEGVFLGSLLQARCHITPGPSFLVYGVT
jgi:hypothetical protein